MEIQALKQQLDIYQVADRLGIEINKHHKANCPFHNDKTPSLQFSKDKQIATCFSGNCNAGTMDVISLVEKKLNVSTHEAIKWLQQEFAINANDVKRPAQSEQPETNYPSLYRTFRESLTKSKKAKDYLDTRGIDYKTLEAGYNSGASWPQMKQCIVFPLKEEQGEIVSLYGRSTYHLAENPAHGGTGRHFYNSNRKGLYPGYPKPETETLILTESIIDSATLQQYTDYPTLALYGTNGLTPEHSEALSQLKQLTEIILFFDGDLAGQEAVKRNGEILNQLLPTVKLSYIETPENEDINSLAVNHQDKEQELFKHLIETRKPILLRPGGQVSPETDQQAPSKPIANSQKPNAKLDTSHPYHLKYTTSTAIYAIKGGLGKQGLDSLKVTLEISNPNTKRKYRNKLDLYEFKQVERVARESAEQLELRTDRIESDLNELTDQLEIYREGQLNEQKKKPSAKPIQNPERVRICTDFMSKPRLIPRLNELIGKAGVIGEENNRIFLFGIAASYKMPDPLHALIQGSSGSGKTHLLTKISSFIPKEDKKHFTRVTEGSFYNYGMYDLKHKLICLEDLDGMKEDAYLAFREMQSRGMISSSTSGKDEEGQIRAFEKVVYGPIASMSCTTKGSIYEDNMNRCFLIAVDESKAQTQKIIQYQNNRSAGEIDKQREKEIISFVTDCIRCLKSYEVVNPYANKVNLPEEAHKLRRLNDLYQSYVKQITLLNQYRRSRDNKDRLVCEKEDLQTAAEIMFDSIILKIDELDGSLREFYERLKAYVQGKGEHPENYSFGQREIRQALNISKTQLQRYIGDLTELEYIRQTGGYANRGYQYKITYWDDIKALRAKVKRHLQGQLDQLEIPVS